ncbi:MAG TPA: helix-turn-helix transcriptional regulator [Solirubrobacterales bacterium]|nr:helix-turn-helix transcriptional regulator [Solirubrobacterales bacterium]
MPTTTPTPARLGNAIRWFRKRRDLSIEELAGKAEIHTTYLSGIELGQRNPSWNIVRSLSEALDIEVSAVVLLAEELADRQRESSRPSPTDPTSS